jgi:hypothetical protein
MVAMKGSGRARPRGSPVPAWSQRLAGGQRRVVVEHVEAAVGIHGRLGQALDLAFVAHVCRDAGRTGPAVTECGGDPLGRVPVDIADDHRCAAGRERLCRRAADAGCAAGDDRDLADDRPGEIGSGQDGIGHHF